MNIETQNKLLEHALHKCDAAAECNMQIKVLANTVSFNKESIAKWAGKANIELVELKRALSSALTGETSDAF